VGLVGRDPDGTASGLKLRLRWALTQAALLGAIAIRFAGETLKWDNQKGASPVTERPTSGSLPLS
jgi:hypothetical protein